MPPTRTTGSVAVALVCLFALFAAGLAPVEAQSAAVVVSNVSHPETPTVGEPFEIRVTIRNAGDTGSYIINEVYTERGYGTDRMAEDLGRLSPGGTTVVSLPVTVDTPGWHVFDVLVNGRSVGTGLDRIRHPVTVHVIEEQRPRLELEVEDAVPGASRSVNVTVANGDGTDIQQVTTSVAAPGVAFSVDQRVAARLAAGEATTFQYPAVASEGGTRPVNVTVDYIRAGERRQVSRTIDADFSGPQTPGEVRLTGTDAVLREGQVEVSATASNVGSTPVRGVVVSVGSTGAVDPATYFVGEIDTSDFSSFTLSTPADGNVSSVPISVRYVVDGVERTGRTEVPVERGEPRIDSPEPRGGGGFPLLPVAVALVVVAGALVLWWRR